MENAYEQRVRMIDEEKNSKEHYKSKVEELKDRLQSISSDHQQELENVKAKYSEQILDESALIQWSENALISCNK